MRPYRRGGGECTRSAELNDLSPFPKVFPQLIALLNPSNFALSPVPQNPFMAKDGRSTNQNCSASVVNTYIKPLKRAHL